MAKGSWKLKLRLILAMFAVAILVYVILGIIWTLIGRPGGIVMWAGMGLIVIFLQYLIGPSLVNMSMGVKEVTREQAPQIYEMVEDLCQKADLPMPKIGVSPTPIPNAFAYGRSQRDGHVCVTQGILDTITYSELKAVLGHELGHIKHYDMAITTIISAIPMICYYVALSTFWSSDNDNNGWILGAVAMLCYFLGQLIVLFVSRTREYYADQASVEFGNNPEHLASALYKLVYGTANCSSQAIKDVEGQKAFFLNDVSNARKDISELSQLDLNGDGTIGAEELRQLQNQNVNISTGSKLMEILSTHPDMLKRIKRLSEMQN